MNISAVFIVRPVATTLLAAGILLAGLMGFVALPVSLLPIVDFPTIQVQTSLKKQLGAIAGVSEITSISTVGDTRITLQFELSCDIVGAARDVQAHMAAIDSGMWPSVGIRGVE